MSGTYYHTVYLTNYLTQNPFTVASNGLVSVTSGDAILGAAGYAWTLFNRGTVASTNGNGVRLTAGGAVANGQSGSSGGLISGSGDGVEIDQKTGTVVNFGTIAGGDDGVRLLGGSDTITN